MLAQYALLTIKAFLAWTGGSLGIFLDHVRIAAPPWSYACADLFESLAAQYAVYVFPGLACHVLTQQAECRF